MRFAPFEFRRSSFDWSRPYVVGIVNVTPDSFSDGGQFADRDAAVAHGLRLVADGADMIDIGGESTRPGATALSAQLEIERVVPVIEALSRSVEVPLSVDTTKAEVARAALQAGAEIVNDVSGGLFDPAIVEVAAAANAAFVCSHLRGATISEVHATEAEDEQPSFDDVARELGERVAALPSALRERTIVDPGLGFGKKTAQNIELSRRSAQLGERVGCPVMVGPSRKRFLGEITGRAVDDRDGATVGAALAAIVSGAQLVRVHDVAMMAPALQTFHAIVRPAA